MDKTDMEKTLENRDLMERFSFASRFGLPRTIIAGFVLLLFITAPIVGVDLTMQIGNVINRFSWNAVLVLALTLVLLDTVAELLQYALRSDMRAAGGRA